MRRKNYGKSGTAIFVDVLPHAPRPANLPPGTIWREKTHMNIPGKLLASGHRLWRTRAEHGSVPA